VNHTFHAISATLVLSIVLTHLASDLNSTLRHGGDGRIRYRREFGYRLFDSHGEMATQVFGACPLTWLRGLQDDQPRIAPGARAKK